MNARRRAWLWRWAELAIRLAPNRMDEAERRRRRRRLDYRTSVTGWPLRITEFLRDRLRPRWLRVRK